MINIIISLPLHPRFILYPASFSLWCVWLPACIPTLLLLLLSTGNLIIYATLYKKHVYTVCLCISEDFCTHVCLSSIIMSIYILHNCISSSKHSNYGSVRHTHTIKLNECLSGMIWLTEHSCRGFIQRLTNLCFNSDGDGKACCENSCFASHIQRFTAEMKCQEVIIALWWLQ